MDCIFTAGLVGLNYRKDSELKLFTIEKNSTEKKRYKNYRFNLSSMAYAQNSLPLNYTLPIYLLIPKEMVYNAVEAIAKKEIKNVVVISAGFKEVGKEGETRENELLKLVRKNDIRCQVVRRHIKLV